MKRRIVTKIDYAFCVDVDNQYKRFFSVYRRQHDHAKHPFHKSVQAEIFHGLYSEYKTSS